MEKDNEPPVHHDPRGQKEIKQPGICLVSPETRA